MSTPTQGQPWQRIYSTAKLACEQEHWLAAEPLLREVLRLAPCHAAAHHLLGKALAAQGNLTAALEAQQQSCQLDPELGWNWFATGELLMELESFSDAATAFDRALALLPEEGWISHQCREARLCEALGGERLADGVGLQTYQYWIEHHEPRLPPPSAAVQEPFWLLDTQGRWQGLHCRAGLIPPPAPLGHSPWPADGWLVLLGDGCVLRPSSIQAIEDWMSKKLDATTLPDLIYTDEDQLNSLGNRCDPWLKPGFTPESFWSSPWLGSLSFWRMSWLRHTGLPLPGNNNKDRFDWILEALAFKPAIEHVPLVLVHSQSPATVDASTMLRHLRSQCEPVHEVKPHPSLPGCFSLRWPLPQRWSCSVVIPTRDRADLLEQCLESVWNTTSEARQAGLELELLVVDNGSVERRTYSLLYQWQTRIRVLQADEPFNWSRLNNKAAAVARGELLLLLNNDIKATQPGWIEAMAAQAFRPAVGCVGAILHYPNGTIQHGGVVVGMRHGADHAYRGLNPDHGVHRGRSRLLTSWGAVTGACLMIRKELLIKVGGFDEGLPVEFNDVDLCLRLAQLGYRHVVDPEAVLEHHESQSRDAEGSTTAFTALKRVKGRWHQRFSTTTPWWPAQSEDNFDDGRPTGIAQFLD